MFPSRSAHQGPVTPDLLVLGQITVDHVVPAEPGPWRELLGGNALFAAAGARLWYDPSRVGVVARCGRGLSADAADLLRAHGLSPDGLRAIDEEPMTEWVLYEPDGERRTLPRNRPLRDPVANRETLRRRYLVHLEALSAAADDIPPHWLPARGVHLAPQVWGRHRLTLARATALAGFLSVDPSPHYAREQDAASLARMLSAATAVLPSRAEVAHLVPDDDWEGLAARFGASGLGEVVIKLGEAGCLVHLGGAVRSVWIPAVPARVVDPTGAGDAFCGAYAASRILGLDPVQAARRAAVAAAMVVDCSGAPAALGLSPTEARARLRDAFPELA